MACPQNRDYMANMFLRGVLRPGAENDGAERVWRDMELTLSRFF